MLTRWNYQEVCPKKIDDLSKNLGISRHVCQILLQKGLQTPEQVRPFLDPKIDQLHPPRALPGIDQLAQQILKQTSKVRIILNTNIDAFCAGALLFQILESGNINFEWQISRKRVSAPDDSSLNIYIGFSSSHVNKQQKNDWLISPLENSNISASKTKCLSSKGDHNYPFKDLSSAGLVYKLADHLAEAYHWPIEPNTMLDLVALACTAEEFPMLGENRVMTFLGLQQIRNRPKNLFLELSRLHYLRSNITTKALQFNVGSLLREMLSQEDPSLIVQWLNGLNLDQVEAFGRVLKDHRKISISGAQTIFKEAERLALARNSKSRFGVVLYRPKWPKASLRRACFKLADRFSKPCVIACQFKDNKIMGVLRSNKELNWNQILASLLPEFDQWTPGPTCSSFVADKKHLYQIAKSLDEYCEAKSTTLPGGHEININVPIKFKELTPDLIQEINQLAPFGKGNKYPVFQTEGVRAFTESITKGDHLQVVLKQGRAPVQPAIGFGMADYHPKIRRNAFDICFTIQSNFSDGAQKMHLNIKDIKLRRKK